MANDDVLQHENDVALCEYSHYGQSRHAVHIASNMNIANDGRERAFLLGESVMGFQTQRTVYML